MIIHIFASRPLNKDKNYIFIVFLSSLSPILVDSIKKQAKNASKRLKIGKSAELFPHFSQRCEFGKLSRTELALFLIITTHPPGKEEMRLEIDH